jgi:hypothetical protein
MPRRSRERGEQRMSPEVLERLMHDLRAIQERQHAAPKPTTPRRVRIDDDEPTTTTRND